MTTLDTLIQQRLDEFTNLSKQLPAVEAKVKAARAKGKHDEKLEALYLKCKSAEDDRISYLLDTVPFIREYEDEHSNGNDAASDTATLVHSIPGQLDEFVQITGTSNRSDIFRRYLMTVEKNPFVQPANDLGSDYDCPHCGGQRLHDTKESSLVCQSCGISETHIGNTERNLTYAEEVNLNKNSAYSYKRLNHMLETISSLQGKENCDIPQEVIDAVKTEFKKQRVTKRGEITPAKVRAFLKKLNLNKYYEHTHYICNLINGVPPPCLPASLEAQIRKMFLMVQKPFEKVCPSTRKNFLSYNYTLHKILQLLGEDQYLQYFPLLKSSQKLFAQDKIWKDITGILSWQFIPSV